MDENQTFESLIEQRRAAWSATPSAYAGSFAPVPATQVVHAFEMPGLDILEDTIPLAKYRPSRL